MVIYSFSDFKNKNENAQKERRMKKRTKIRRVMIRDNKSLCQKIFENFIKISMEVYKLLPFKKTILVKFDFGGHVLKKLRN